MNLTPDDIINFVRLYFDREGKDKECAARHGCEGCYYRSFCDEDEVDAFIKELEPFAISVKELRSTIESQERDVTRLKLAALDGGSADKEEIAVLKGELEYCRSEITRLTRAIQALIWETPQSP